MDLHMGFWVAGAGDGQRLSIRRQRAGSRFCGAQFDLAFYGDQPLDVLGDL
jgi:hypothetical protein